MTNKINSITLTRIISMIFIILCHIIPYYHFVPGAGSLSGIFNVGIYTFLLISGYLYGGKEIKDFKKWYLNRILKICLPATIFVSIFSLVFLVLGEKYDLISYLVFVFNLSGLGSCVKVFGSLFNEIGAFSHLWFIFNIMVSYLFLPLFYKLKCHTWSKSQSIYVLFTSLLMNYMLSTLVNVTFIYVITFFAGYILRTVFNDELKSNRTIVLMTGLMLVMQVSRIVINIINFNPQGYSAFSEMSHLTLGVWILISIFYFEKLFPVLVDRLCNNKVAQLLDANSFYFYITHHAFSVTSSMFCCYKVNNLLLATVLFIGCTLVSTYLLQLLMNYIYKLPIFSSK